MGSKKIRNMNVILKYEYDFDATLEKRIYAYLCFRKVKKNKLPEELKFNYYKEWEDYIKDKYKIYDSNKMKEFSKLLNLQINNIQFENTYWYLVIPILLTIITNFILEFMTKMQLLGEMHVNLWINIIAISITAILSFPIIIMMIIKIFKPMIINQDDYNFYKDYKEIIEKINSNRD